MQLHHALRFALPLVLFSAQLARAADAIWLDQLDLATMRQGSGAAKANLSQTGAPLTISGQRFERGVSVHANSTYRLVLAGGTDRFTAQVGLDDSAGGNGAVIFTLIADGKKVYDSGIVRNGEPARAIDVDLRGAQMLLLSVTHGPGRTAFNHGDWASAQFTLSGAAPRPFIAPPETPVLLTSKPGPEPRLNSAKAYGARPGNPFLYHLPTQGARPMRFSADNLPSSLQLDADTGIVTGRTPAAGEYVVTFHARNAYGTASRTFKLVSGDTLALTPPMGWNHWYAHGDRITDSMMREAADILLASGLADVGYDYVNIDDCWMNAPKQRDPLRVGPARDAAGNILPNRHFPDMKALTDYIHARGLKAGIYSSPGEFTCGGFHASFGHEEQDAKQFAAWGFDFLKYDWCSYRRQVADTPVVEQWKKPYAQMGRLLRAQDRDIQFNLCQYGNADVWTWGKEVGGQSWRTAGDLGFELERFIAVALKNAEHREWNGPGSWNDPDYIQIGYLGREKDSEPRRQFPLTPTEQYAYMSLWALMAAPIFYSGDIAALDEFTLNVLTNREVIEINQDPLGECGRVIMVDAENFIMVKRLEDGSHAIGLGNGSDVPARLTAHWIDLGLAPTQQVRDVWRQKSLGAFPEEFSVEVPRHGVVLLRVQPQN